MPAENVGHFRHFQDRRISFFPAPCGLAHDPGIPLIILHGLERFAAEYNHRGSANMRKLSESTPKKAHQLHSAVIVWTELEQKC